MSTLAEAHRPGKARQLVIGWLVFVLVCCVSSIAMEFAPWAGVPVQAGPVTIHLTLYLPMVLCTFALFWLGFPWACIAAFAATFAGALVGGMTLGSALLFSCADPVWLAVFALAYRVMPLRIDLRNAASAASFVAIALVAAFAGSTGSFVYSYHKHLNPGEVFAIWQGWWLGGFLQTIAFNLPGFLVAGPTVARLRRRHLLVGQRPTSSVLWASAAVTAVCLALVLFVVATGQQGFHCLRALGQTVAPMDQLRLAKALWAWKLLMWHSLFLVLLMCLGAFLLVVYWNRSMRSEVEARTKEIQASRLRFALAAKASNEGLWDWDLVGGRIHFSPRWREMLGYEEEDIGDTVEAWIELVHPDERGQLEAALDAHLEGYTSTFEGEFRLRHRDGSYRTMLSRGLCVRDEDGRVVRMAGSQTDISESRAAQQRLVHDAFHDELTGLPNRALFIDRLGGAIARARRNFDYLYSVLFLDLDHFKNINDTLGHRMGDLLLKGISERLTSCLRPVDTVSRFGGDEFTILLDNINNTQNATELADRIHHQLSRPFILEGNEVFTSASIGIASSRAGYSSPEEVLRDADTAMYHAKSLGKARHQVFDTAMHAQSLRLLLLETDLRRAIERNELVLYYQPVFDLVEREIVGCEALLRWIHPKWGMVPQTEFLPLAEETGLIIPMGKWVYSQACCQLAEWRNELGLSLDFAVGINLSERQLVHPELLEELEEAVQSRGLENSCLRLEITETSLEVNREAALRAVTNAQRRGFTIELEDFGSGVSSLSLIHSLPLHALKIDRSWVASMATDDSIRHMVTAVTELAQALNLELVAEGVENEDQVTLLQSLGCRRAQGYLFASVLSAQEFAERITSQ